MKGLREVRALTVKCKAESGEGRGQLAVAICAVGGGGAGMPDGGQDFIGSSGEKVPARCGLGVLYEKLRYAGGRHWGSR